MKFRKLLASEIEVRPSTVNDKGVGLLLYKDARCDQRLLDETVGAYNWKRTHQMLGDMVLCTVSIKDPETGEWIEKQDVGSENMMEKEKSVCSDSFKRAAFCWGCGRELYTAPRIWIYPEKVNITESKGRYYCNDKFHVDAIDYLDDRICYLRIVKEENKGKSTTVFEWGNPADVEKAKTSFISETQAKALTARCQSDGVSPTKLCEEYKVNDFSEMTLKMYNNANEHWDQVLAKYGEKA